MNATLYRMMRAAQPVLILLLVYLMLELPGLWSGARGPGPARARLAPGVFFVFLACPFLATGRAARHPFYIPAYRRWLESTPWTRAKPLPLGPIHFDWVDLLNLIGIGLFVWLDPAFNPFQLVSLYILGFLATLAFALLWTGAQGHAYAAAFGMGLAVRLWHTPSQLALTTVLVYLLAAAGLRQSLGKFPWKLDRFDAWLAQSRRSSSEPSSTGSIAAGWPFARLSPHASEEWGLPRHHGVLLSLLAGWWLYAISAVLPEEFRPAMWLIYTLLLQVVFFARIVIYTTGYASPINIWGRLFTGRWIVPGYDKVFIVPLLVILASTFVPYELWTNGLPAPAVLGISLALTLLLALNGGPSLRRWRLTGHHRIAPPGAAAQGGQALVKVG